MIPGARCRIIWFTKMIKYVSKAMFMLYTQFMVRLRFYDIFHMFLFMFINIIEINPSKFNNSAIGI